MSPGRSGSAVIWSTESHARADASVVPDVAFVLIHGSLDRSAGLLKLGRRLVAIGTVVRYDRRGYGRSMPHDGPFTMADQVADLGSVLAEHGHGRRWVLVGHSYGGDVALAAATEHPDVAAVVVYEPPLSWTSWWPHGTAGGSAVQIARSGGPTAAGDAAEAFMRNLIGVERWSRLPPATRAARRAEGTAMVAELVDLRRSAPWDAEAISVPVLALAGGESRPHHRRAVLEVAATIHGAEHADVAGASHFGPNTHPDATAAAIGDFVRRRL